MPRIPKYRAIVKGFKGTLVLVAETLSEQDDWDLSLTNAIEEVATRHGVDNVVYRDSEGRWDGWNRRYGFILLDSVNPYDDVLLNRFIMKKQLLDID